MKGVRTASSSGDSGDGGSERAAASRKHGFREYFFNKTNKLDAQFEEQRQIALEQSGSLDPSLQNLFNGVRIWVNGYTEPTAWELKNLMTQYGGGYEHYNSSRVSTPLFSFPLFCCILPTSAD
jgi:DNA repair protein REV1